MRVLCECVVVYVSIWQCVGRWWLVKALRTGEAIVSQGAQLPLLGMVAEDNGRFPVSDLGGLWFWGRGCHWGDGGAFIVVMELANV